MIIGAGNIAELHVVPNRVDVKNNSCSDYYLWLRVDVPPLPPEVDAGNDAGEQGDGDDAGDAGRAD